MKKLTDINQRELRGANNPAAIAKVELLAKPKPVSIAPASVNRRRSEGRIAQENMLLYRRLQAIRPSSDIRRDMLEIRHSQNQRYKENCSVFGRHKNPGRNLWEQKR